MSVVVRLADRRRGRESIWIFVAEETLVMGLGWQELLLVFMIVLLLFGAKRLPEIARSLGKASNEFKRAKDEFMDETRQQQPRQVQPPKDDDKGNA